jgi:hypothetical protein
LRIMSGKIVLQREPTRLASLVRSAVEANRAAMAAKRIELSVELPKDDCVIDVDPTRFVQILSNLLHNAAKFTNNDGSVSVSATVTRPQSDVVSQVSITVVDSGIGISPDFLPRVFDLFTQGETRSSQPGLGIGLALARRLAELHGGHLDARSEGHGRGSAFVIHVPLAMTQSLSAIERRAAAGCGMAQQEMVKRRPRYDVTFSTASGRPCADRFEVSRARPGNGDRESIEGSPEDSRRAAHTWCRGLRTDDVASAENGIHVHLRKRGGRSS